MSSGYSNRHHGVPRSFTGSDVDRNIVTVPCLDHAEYHRVTGHLPLDFTCRFLALSMVDWENPAGNQMPPGFIEDVLSELDRDDWRSSYHAEAIRFPGRNDTVEVQESFARSSIHVYNHICTERYAVSDAIAYCTRGNQEKYLRPSTRAFCANVQEFTGMETPAQAMRQLLLDRSPSGYLKWAEQMLPGIRSRLLDATRYANPEQLTKRSRERIQEVLRGHRTFLETRLKHWEPNVSAYEWLIHEKKDTSPFFSQFLAKKKAAGARRTSASM